MQRNKPYIHLCKSCGKLIIDFEIKETTRGELIVDVYCQECETKEPLNQLFCKVINKKEVSVNSSQD